MKELSGRASAVLEHYRAVESLRETEKGRLLDTLQARAARGDSPMAGADTPFPSPVPNMGFLGRVWTAPFAKGGIGVTSVAVTAALVGLAVTRPKAPVARAPVPATTWADDPGTLNHARPEPPKAATNGARPVAPATTSPQEAPGEATVDEEVRLLHDAQLALRSADPRRAMALLDEHAAKFPSGKLSDAREVTRMVALCNLGARAAAREKADHFLAQHPGSPFSDRVRRICASSDP